MKLLFLAVLGIIAGWIIISFITNDFNDPALFSLIIGTFLGYSVAKQEMKNKERN